MERQVEMQFDVIETEGVSGRKSEGRGEERSGEERAD